MAKIKFAGRPDGAPNKKSQFVRDEKFNHFRCTEGFTQTLRCLQDELGGSKADVLHDALQFYAFKKLKDPAAIFWAGKIQ